MTYLLVVFGLVCLALGGELLVRGAVGVARRLGVSPLLAGLTLVGFGTSTPELVTSLGAAFAGSPGIALGNVVGSNVANILLILGVSALLLPLAVVPGAFRRDSWALMLSTVACVGLALAGEIGRWTGLGLLVVLVAYIVWAYRSERRAGDAEAEVHEQMAAEIDSWARSLPVLGLMTLVGIAATVVGARLLVDGAITLARQWGVTETVIGLTVVSVGTSLPELVACVVAALRRHADVAVGNVIGSNIYNVFGILGATAAVHPLTVPSEIARFDVWVLAGVTALALVFLRSRWTVERWEGICFLVLYGVYLVVLGVG
jgi:cation:H+ antiporter